ncbi:hypothetical protein Scep_021373 [Stephania cephalantha]|uniref:Uncharacterized protein n=1 Tax=Stephania cephalantha TaxID=152367 RepID=A0AAP0FDG8_9MAGN
MCTRSAEKEEMRLWGTEQGAADDMRGSHLAAESGDGTWRKAAMNEGGTTREEQWRRGKNGDAGAERNERIITLKTKSGGK